MHIINVFKDINGKVLDTYDSEIQIVFNIGNKVELNKNNITKKYEVIDICISMSRTKYSSVLTQTITCKESVN